MQIRIGGDEAWVAGAGEEVALGMAADGAGVTVRRVRSSDLGKPGPVTLLGVAAPIDLADLSALATEKGVASPKGLSLLESSFFKFEELSRRNALLRCDVTLNQAEAGAPSYRPH